MTSILRTHGREASERRTGRGNRRRIKPAFHFDRLEPRTLLTATLSVDGAGAASLLSQTLGSTVDLSYNTGTHAYTFDSTEGILAGTVDAAFTYDQVSANEATLTPVDAGTQDFTALSFDQDVENIDYSITSLGTTTTFVDTSLTPPVGTPLSDTFDFGATGHAQSSITAPVSIALTTESAAIMVDDSADTTSQVINISSTQVDFDSTPAFSYASTATVASLAVLGGSGGNSVDVTGTPAGTSAASTTTTYTESGTSTGDAVFVQDTSQYGPLTLNNLNATSSVDVGNNSGSTLGNLAGILGAVDITGATALPLTVSDFNNTGDFTATLEVDSVSGQGELIDLAPAAITYDLGSLSGITVKTGIGQNVLAVDFTGGNPLTPNSNGLVYDGSGSTSQLILENGTFTVDSYAPKIPGTAGASITLTDASANTYPIAFQGLASVSDVLTVADYTFTAPIPSAADPASQQGYYVDLSDGPTIDSIKTAAISSPASPAIFTTLNYANKASVTIDLTPIWQAANPVGAGFLYDNTNTAGQSSLDVLLGQGDDTVDVEATAPGVTTTITLGSGNDTATVVGLGLAAGTTSSNFRIDGGTGTNTLVLDSSGTTVDVSTPGIVTFGDPTSFAYANFSVIQVSTTQTNTAPVITAGATITTAQNVPLINAVIATFTDADTIENASSYTASIQWADGTTSAGTITSSGTSTILGATVNDYSITGTHTYTTGGTYATSVVLTDLGGTFTSAVGGIPVTTTLAPLAPINGTGATINVNALAAGTFTLVQATAGTTTSFPSLFTFTESPSPMPLSYYSATIDWGDGSPLSLGTITAAAGVFTVAGSHNYGQVGTYTITVSITGDSQQLTASTTAGQQTVVGVTVTPISGLTATAGTPTGPLTVAIAGVSFLDSAGYTAVVDWGDGTTTVVPSFIGSGHIDLGFVDVGTSGHTYAQGGTYNLTVTLRDSQGFVVGTANPTILVGVTLGGRLSPQSDSGISNSDGITDVTTPTFVGNTTPGTTVEVFATPSGSAVVPGTQIAIGSADTAGAWSATVVNTPLTDGSYKVTAEAVDSFGNVLGTASLGTVVIDTVGPVVTALTFDRFDDTVTVTYQDNLSGLAYASIASSSSYQLSAKPLAKNVPVPKMLLPTSILITPGATATSPEVVTVVFNHGKTVRGGRYLVVIDSGTGGTGVEDVAGNALDGNFYGTFPSGNGLPGGDFVASIDTFHNNIVLAPVPVKDGYVPPSAAVDPPAHAKTIKKVANVVNSNANVVGQPIKQAKVHDMAIEALFTPKKDKRRRG